MSRDFGQDVPDLEKLHARKLWADFSYPTHVPTDVTGSIFSLQLCDRSFDSLYSAILYPSIRRGKVP